MPLILGVLVVVLIAAGIVAVLEMRRQRRQAASNARTQAAAESAAASPSPPASLAPGVPSDGLHEMLDVSRRLASPAEGDIDRAIVREATGLVPARAAALLNQSPAGLIVSCETEPGVVVADRLGSGIIEQVAETGQSSALVSATEPAITNLPVALVAIPFVVQGQVAAVLVMVRDAAQPFTVAEQTVLESLSPVAAAAIHSARQVAAAMEDSLTDPLTGVGNRRRLDRDLPLVLAGAEGPTSLAIVDLDLFKRVNDTHGHQVGDALLQAVARVVHHAVRPEDGVYRFGGEEFCILMQATTPSDAAGVAERVRAAVAAQPFEVGTVTPLGATASLGVASQVRGEAASLFAAADSALYEAKGAGRNRVCVAGTAVGAAPGGAPGAAPGSVTSMNPAEPPA